MGSVVVALLPSAKNVREIANGTLVLSVGNPPLFF
jgi:hypothetical protein